MGQINEKVGQYVEEIRALLGTAPHLYRASFSDLYGAEPYRRLVGLGHEALPALLDELKKGDLFLNRAFLEILRIKATDLGLDQFASEQEISEALTSKVKFAEISNTAAAAGPQPCSPAPQSASWPTTPKKVSPWVMQGLQQR